MRYAELLFLALLAVYHVALLLPRHRRPFSSNYLVFLAGTALVWSLATEGLRWQTLPPLLLLLIDLAVLFPTFATLRGKVPPRKWWVVLGAALRGLVATLGLVVAVGSGVLSVVFPLPKVGLTGGTSPSQRVVRFPATGDADALELRLWYPASGDTNPQPRLISSPEAWQEHREEGGLPVFWQSYWEHLPTPNIVGGRLAAPKSKYPVIFVVTPSDQPAADFGYLFEDLASRGFVVVAGAALPPPLPTSPSFDWTAAGTEVLRPLLNPTLWLEPEATREAGRAVPDGRWLKLTHRAVEQLDQEPGDLLFGAIDWNHQGLWVWGPDPGLGPTALKALGIQTVIRAGASPSPGEESWGQELWVSPTPGSVGSPGRWVLSIPGLRRADLADSAYLKPYLAAAGLKSQADAGNHPTIRQYQAAFYHYAFWNAGDGTTFAQTVPQVPGLTLTGR